MNRVSSNGRIALPLPPGALFSVVAILFLALPTSAEARRQTDTTVVAAPAPIPESAARDVFHRGTVTPRGAFLRSLVFPGWGHVAADAPARAAFYVAAQGGTVWMLTRSIIRRHSARRYRDDAFDAVRAELRTGGIQHPDSLRFLALADPRVERWEDLVEIRSDQVEDWLAFGIFLTLLGATDALVAAHLSNFPEPLGMTIAPRGGALGGWEVGFSLPLALPRREGSWDR